MSVATNRRPKSIFRSLGFMSGVLATLVGFAQFLLTPEGFDRAATCLDTFGQNHAAETVRSLTPLLVILLGAAGSFGRYRASEGLYTPKLLPGPNKPPSPSLRRAEAHGRPDPEAPAAQNYPIGEKGKWESWDYE